MAARLSLESEGALFRVSFLSSLPSLLPSCVLYLAYPSLFGKTALPCSPHRLSLPRSRGYPCGGPHVPWYRAYPIFYQPAFLPGYTTIYPISRESSCVANLLAHGCIRVWIVID